MYTDKILNREIGSNLREIERQQQFPGIIHKQLAIASLRLDPTDEFKIDTPEISPFFF